MTLTELRSAIRTASLIDSSSVSDATLTLYVNQGIHEIATAYTWPWLEASATVSLTAATQNVNLPADFLYGLALVDDDNDNVLPYVSPQRFFDLVGNDTGNTSTNPSFYTIFDDDLYFSPIPSANDTNRFTLYYYRTSAADELSADGDTPPFIENYHWILVEYVLWKLYNREEYYSQSERSFITYSRYLQDMMAFYGRRIKEAPFLWGDGGPHGGRHTNIPLLNL